jgi:PAB-dependent poly(A)-specific ribonuclease subunit 2
MQSLRTRVAFLFPHMAMQGTTHDAIEDARTALMLYEKYKQLVRDGSFDEKLAEMYRWGSQHGWETVTLGQDGAPVAQPVQA